MSSISSPTRFNNPVEDHLFELEDNLEKLKCPLKAGMAGDYDVRKAQTDDASLDMYVPDRILVVGQDQYYGTTAPPRELRLENSVRPPDPGFIHVETPPRVISLSEYKFPTVGEDELSPEEEPILSHSNVLNNFTTPKKSSSRPNSINKVAQWTPLPDSELNRSTLSVLPPSEEIIHLRQQMAKLNRRLMALELEQVHQKQREMGLIALGAAYFIAKIIIWLNK